MDFALDLQSLVALIGDIIRLSQLDEGAPLPWEQVDIPALCRDIAADLRDKAEKSQVRLTVEGQDVQAEGVRCTRPSITSATTPSGTTSPAAASGSPCRMPAKTP